MTEAIKKGKCRDCENDFFSSCGFEMVQNIYVEIILMWIDNESWVYVCNDWCMCVMIGVCVWVFWWYIIIIIFFKWVDMYGNFKWISIYVCALTSLLTNKPIPDETHINIV